MHRLTATVVVLLALAAAPVLAQQSTGHVAGRVADEQGAAVPGVLITGTSRETGFVRTDLTDREGLYQLNALPVGNYDIVAQLKGFTRVESQAIVVNVSQTTDLNITLRVAAIAETVSVVGKSPLIPTTSSSVGQVVDISRIESIPLNGRQFANLAAIVPGVGIGFNSDLTKGLQYTPQIGGGNGRNINYQMDGGDNNDDTVGGLLQLFPLEAVQEFNVLAYRFDAQYGRGASVMNVVTKSGTNELRGTWFTLFRDDALNAKTFTEAINKIPKQDYRRYQFGGSAGGPISRDKAHFFAAYERTQQDTKQAVNTLGLLPGEDGVYDTPFRENLLTAKVTTTLGAPHYLAVRYARNTNSQPNGAGLRAAPSAWSTSSNTFNSLNVNHNWMTAAARLNEFVFQYADFANEIPGSSSSPFLMFPNGVTSGSNPVAPQSTEQTKWQFRDDLSWTASEWGGLAHEVKAGVNWIHEPHLFISTTGGSAGFYTMASNDLNGPVQQVQVIGGASAVNIPLDLYSLYIKDDWRVTGRLTLNIGLRWDYVDGLDIDQSRNPNFQAMQAAGRAGRFAGTVLDDFGKDPKSDLDNIQPRLGFALDATGDGRDVIRGGWGIYTDFAYTNTNALTPAIDAVGGSGLVFLAVNPSGIRKPDGTFFRASDPLASIAALNVVNPNLPPLTGVILSPRLEQPFTYQTNIGWAHEFSADTAITADYVRAEGRDLNVRLRSNTIVDGRRYLGDLGLQPNSIAIRTGISRGTSLYDGLILGLRRRFSRGFDATASYTFSRSVSSIGSASDELDQNLVQDIRNPFGPVQDAPSMRTDARHRVSISAVVQAPLGLHVSPILLYRSALPAHSFEGLDLNGDGNVNDKTASAYRYTGLSADGRATFQEAGACKTVNCSRRAPYSQLNLRISRSVPLNRDARMEIIGEMFNVFNASNPFIPIMTRRLSAGGAPLASFMQPTAFAGDFQQPEQRIGQLGVRFTF